MAYLAWERSDELGVQNEETLWVSELFDWEAEADVRTAEQPAVYVNGVALEVWLVLDEDSRTVEFGWVRHLLEADGLVDRWPPDPDGRLVHGSKVRVQVMRTKGYASVHGLVTQLSNGTWVYSIGGPRAWDGHGRRSTHSNLRPHEADRVRQRRLALRLIA